VILFYGNPSWGYKNHTLMWVLDLIQEPKVLYLTQPLKATLLLEFFLNFKYQKKYFYMLARN